MTAKRQAYAANLRALAAPEAETAPTQISEATVQEAIAMLDARDAWAVGTIVMATLAEVGKGLDEELARRDDQIAQLRTELERLQSALHVPPTLARPSWWRRLLGLFKS